ncbi:MAG: hypothetical protein Q9216_005839 [Gyalolechia sp. 2 TL-2023]
MAAVGQVVVSSSPILRVPVTAPFSASTNATSSSPGLPSPSQFLDGKSSRFNIGSAAVLRSQDPNLGFVSASGLPHPFYSDKMMSTIRCDESPPLKANSAGLALPTAAAGGGKEDMKKGLDIGRRKKAKGTSQSESKPYPDLTLGQLSIAISTPDKHNAKKPRKDDQSTIRRAKITKPGAGTTRTKRSKKMVTAATQETQDVVCEDKASREKIKEAPVIQNDQDLGLLEAPRRKKDWTPVKRIAGEADGLNDAETVWSTMIPYESPSLGKNLDAGFGKLVGNFGCTDVPKHNDTNYTSHDLSFTKRRKLDLVTGIALTAPMAIPPKRSKSPKKKPQTITDKATAPFIPEGQATTSIRSYFATPVVDIDLHCSNRAFVSENGSAKPGTEPVPTKKPTKATRKKAKAPKATKRPVKLLSPESAMRTTKEQDLLFGTSSQLAREESPTFLRNVQQALRESEIFDDTKSLLHENQSQVSAQSITSKASSSTFPTGSRNLWAVAARDSAGSLLQVDVVDLIDTPQSSCSLSTAPKVVEGRRKLELSSESPLSAVDEGWNRVEDITEKEPTIPLAIDPHDDQSAIPRSVAESSLRERPRSRSPVKKPRKRKDSNISTNDTLPQMPKYHSFTIIELNKAAAAFGFKPMRRREELIPLLETCWKSKNRIALQSLPPTISETVASSGDAAKDKPEPSNLTKRRGRPSNKMSAEPDGEGSKAKSTASPKKPRGRPKKSTAAKRPRSTTPTNGHADERSVARPAPSSPSPSRGASAKTSRPLAMTSSSTASAAARDLDIVLPMITKAVAAYPPTHDPNNLTWYEKILLYDPIVLEDLADWLNRKGLGAVGCTELVSPMMVKQWCESQSVCSLWKENLRGGKRARY